MLNRNQDPDLRLGLVDFGLNALGLGVRQASFMTHGLDERVVRIGCGRIGATIYSGDQQGHGNGVR